MQAELKASYRRMKKEATGVFISPEQLKTAKRIVAAFEEKQLVTLIAQPQWGKTGTFLSAAYKLCLRDVQASQVYVITGLADKVWEAQTRERMLPQFRDNVYHRGQLRKLLPVLKKATDALVIIDECHYASNSNQTIKKLLEEAGLLNINTLTKKNIKILQTSATPDNVLLDSKSWADYHTIVAPTEYGESYTSFQRLIEEERMFESFNLTDPCEAESLFEIITSFKKPKYHIIRLPRRGRVRGDIDDNIEAFCIDYDIGQYHYDSTNKEDINMDELLAKKPLKHTIITIVDYWRAAKTLNDKHIGILHERLVQRPNSTAIAQSLAGRCVGHNRNPKVFVFTHIKAVEQYIELTQNGFEYETTKYYSTSIRSNGEGRVTAKASYAHDCKGIDHERYISKGSNQYGWRLFKGKTPRADAQEFVQKYLGLKKLPARKKNADGFYVQNDVKEDPLYTYDRYFGKDGAPSTTRIFKGLSGNNADAKKMTNWRQYAIYMDGTDPDTLMWFICWRRNVYPDAPST